MNDISSTSKQASISPWQWVQAILSNIRAQCPAGGRVVFVSGNFNIIHPGHMRLLNFAAGCGDYLVVGVNPDSASEALLPQELRLESVRAIGVVNQAAILLVPPEDFIRLLKPAIVVKGKEHESQHNPELEAINEYGGKLLFSSGEVQFSSRELLQRELHETNFSTIVKPLDFLTRHNFAISDLFPIVRKFAELHVVVVGDLIVDEYINCEPLGMSQEDPTLVVTPLTTERFIGGGAIVAAHARGLGAGVKYYSVAGADPVAGLATELLKKYDVNCSLVVDESRPTTVKQKYRAGYKTLLRVSHLRQHDISAALAADLFEKIVPAVRDADLMIFSDFNYGCLPQSLVNDVIDHCREFGVMMAADSQASSQLCDLSRFKGMRLLTPTEHEARISVRDTRSGLVVLAETLRKHANAVDVLITLGPEGLLVHSPVDETGNFMTDQLPAFNRAPKDVSGAGDSLLSCASMALAAGASIWQAAYLGSLAAGCQVGRIGNLPLRAEELLAQL
jgi:rfaE bifunctional protein kinase chain/domain